MKLVVCSLDDLPCEIRARRPAAVISLLAPDQEAPALDLPDRRLLLRCHDVAAAGAGFVHPGDAIVADLLAFARRLPGEATVIVHCWMGISRSPAAAFVLACALAPTAAETAIARELRRRSPSATPNPLLVRHGDEQLGRGGRMVEAIARIGRGRLAAGGSPFELDTSLLAAGSSGKAR